MASLIRLPIRFPVAVPIALLSLFAIDQAIRPITAIANPSQIADIVPEDAIGVILTDTNPTHWKSLSQFGIFPAQTFVPDEVFSLPIKAKFATDLEPWIGEQAAYVFLNTPDKQGIAIATIKDPAKLEQYLDSVKRSREETPQQKLYKGVEILEWQPKPESDRSKTLQKPNQVFIPVEPAEIPSCPPPEDQKCGPTATPKPKPLTIARLPNYLLAANSIEALQQVIDTQTSGKSIAKLPDFQKAAANASAKKALIFGYTDYRKGVGALEEFNRSSSLSQNLPLPFPSLPVPNLPSANSAKLGEVGGRIYRGIAGYVWADSQGMHLQTQFYLRQKLSDREATQLNSPNQILGQLPDTNYLMSNGYNLAEFWKFFAIAAERQPALQKQVAQFRQFSQSFIGVDDRDILPWLDGEMTSFFYPTRSGFLPNAVPNLDVAFGMMVKPRDRQKAEAAMTKLDRFIQTRFGTQVVNPQPGFTNWEFPLKGKKQNVATHGWINEDTIVMLGGGGALSDFNLKPNRSLLQSSNFQDAIAPFPKENMGYFYLNSGAMMSLVNGVMKNSTIGNWLASIRSVSATSSLTPDYFQMDGFLSLSQKRKE